MPIKRSFWKRLIVFKLLNVPVQNIRTKKGIDQTHDFYVTGSAIENLHRRDIQQTLKE